MDWSKQENLYNAAFTVDEFHYQMMSDPEQDEYLDWNKEHAAADMGALIGRKHIDAWDHDYWTDPGEAYPYPRKLHRYKLSLYVFTPDEIKDLERHFRAMEREHIEENYKLTYIERRQMLPRKKR